MRYRRYAVFVALAGTACASVPRQQWDRVAEEKLIYASAIDTALSAKKVVLRRSTQTGMTRDRVVSSYWSYLGRMPGISPEMVRDFEEANSNPILIDQVQQRRTEIIIVDDSVFKDFPQVSDIPSPAPQPGAAPKPSYWGTLHSRFPGAEAIVSVTRPGFSKDRRKAMVQVDYGCGLVCGAGHIVVLERGKTGWRVVHSHGTWVS